MGETPFSKTNEALFNNASVWHWPMAFGQLILSKAKCNFSRIFFSHWLALSEEDAHKKIHRHWRHLSSGLLCSGRLQRRLSCHSTARHLPSKRGTGLSKRANFLPKACCCKCCSVTPLARSRPAIRWERVCSWLMSMRCVQTQIFGPDATNARRQHSCFWRY